MEEFFDLGQQADGSPLNRPQHKPELPLPKVSYAEFMEAQEDEEVRKALREVEKEAKLLAQEGKIRT